MEKKFKTGLIVGKFFPLHKGHQYLIETALKQSEKLTVIVCHCDKYNIDPNKRAGWIRKLYPQVKVKIFRHDNSLDNTSTDISPKWAKITIKFLGYIPDAVFSSENYGLFYSNCMGCTHVLVDKKRENVPISGTLIRSNPFKYWKYLSEPVRGYFTKRIVVLGAESTGTTTLAKALAKQYKTSWVPEYGRTYFEGKITAENQNWNTDEFIHIAKTQNAFEDSLANKSNGFLICDTDAFATRLWHERYMGFLSPKLDKIKNTGNKSLYILTGDEIPFVQDGLRDGEQIRHQMHLRFIEELDKHNLRYIIVKGSRKSRLHQAVKEINNYFQNKLP